LNSIEDIDITPSGKENLLKLYVGNDFDRIRYSQESFRENGLFRLSEFDNVQELVTNWLRLHESIPHVFKLFFDSIHLGFQFNTSKFLGLIQAIESYHAIRENNQTIHLRDRVIQLLAESDDWVKNLVNDREAFVNDLMNTRNYYTHYNPNKKNHVAQGLRLEALIHLCRILLSYNFLLGCKIDAPRTQEIIQRGMYWSSMKHIVSENNLWV